MSEHTESQSESDSGSLGDDQSELGASEKRVMGLGGQTYETSMQGDSEMAEDITRERMPEYQDYGKNKVWLY